LKLNNSLLQKNNSKFFLQKKANHWVSNKLNKKMFLFIFSLSYFGFDCDCDCDSDSFSVRYYLIDLYSKKNSGHFTDYNSIELAKQMIMLDVRLFSSIKAREFFFLQDPTEEKAPNLLRMYYFFFKVSSFSCHRFDFFYLSNCWLFHVNDILLLLLLLWYNE
jgi:hypothetical protein